MGNLISNMLYFVKTIMSLFKYIYDIETSKKDYKSSQEELKFKLCVVKKYPFFRKLQEMKDSIRK